MSDIDDLKKQFYDLYTTGSGNVNDLAKQFYTAAIIADGTVTHASNHGAVGDGTTDDTAALQTAINTGKPVILQAGYTYLISSGLDHVDGSGLVCLDGIATIKAKTGVGGFNITTTAVPRTGLDRNMFRCNQTDDLYIRNIHFTLDGATDVVLHGIRLHGGMATDGYDIRGVSFSGFDNGIMIALSSVGAGKRRIIDITSATDSGTSLGNTYWTGGVQTTVVDIDSDQIASTASSPGVIKIGQIKDILLSGTALTAYGQQTDGVNIVVQGANSTSGWKIDVDSIDGIGEPIDIQGWRNTIRIGTIKNAYNDAIKLIHGAQYNDITVGTVEASGRSVVGVFGSDAADRDTYANTVKVGTVKTPGTYGMGTTGTTQVVLFGNSNSTYKPVNNYISVDEVIGDGTNLDYVVVDGGADSNNENRVTIGYATGFATASVSAPPDNVRVKYLNRCFTEMTMSAGQSVGSATATKVAFNTVTTDLESIADTANNKVRVKWPGLYHIQAQVRADAWAVGASDQWVLEIRKNATPYYAKGKINFSAKDEVIVYEKDIYFAENEMNAATADIYVYLTQDTGASKTISNAAGYTFFDVTRIG